MVIYGLLRFIFRQTNGGRGIPLFGTRCNIGYKDGIRICAGYVSG